MKVLAKQHELSPDDSEYLKGAAKGVESGRARGYAETQVADGVVPASDIFRGWLS